MAGTASKGGRGGGKASNAALDDNEDLKVRRGKYFRTWAAARQKKMPNMGIAPSEMLCHYPNSPKPPAR